jgi:hypothetical protein
MTANPCKLRRCGSGRSTMRPTNECTGRRWSVPGAPQVPVALVDLRGVVVTGSRDDLTAALAAYDAPRDPFPPAGYAPRYLERLVEPVIAAARALLAEDGDQPDRPAPVALMDDNRRLPGPTRAPTRRRRAPPRARRAQPGGARVPRPPGLRPGSGRQIASSATDRVRISRWARTGQDAAVRRMSWA